MPSKWPPPLVFEAMCECAWPILRTRYNPNCCVAATRIGIAVLERFGISGRPIVSRALAGNRAFAEWAAESFTSGAPPSTPPPADARYVDIDIDDDSGRGIPGHLIITGKARGEHFLLDLSAPQFDRPAKSINVPLPLFATLPHAWPLQALCRLDDGTVVHYGPHPRPETVRYEESKDWRMPEERIADVAALAEEMARQIAEHVEKAKKTGV